MVCEMGVMTNEQLVALINAHDNEAENMLQLWTQNKGFICKMAKKYSGYAETDDLEQEGYIGLCEAVRHYEPAAGVSFLNYAAYWIKHRMQRYIENCGNVVKLPVYAQYMCRKYKRIYSDYQKLYGTEPPESVLCALLQVSRKELYAIQDNVNMSYVQSFDEPAGFGEDVPVLEECVPSGENMEDDCIERIDKENMKKEVWIAVDKLPAAQSQIIQYRYREGLTLKETGERQGMSIECVRQFQSKAMRTLRLPKYSGKLRPYFEQYLAAAPIRHIGVESFRRSWTSEVERDALRM